MIFLFSYIVLAGVTWAVYLRGEIAHEIAPQPHFVAVPAQ